MKDMDVSSKAYSYDFDTYLFCDDGFDSFFYNEMTYFVPNSLQGLFTYT